MDQPATAALAVARKSGNWVEALALIDDQLTKASTTSGQALWRHLEALAAYASGAGERGRSALDVAAGLERSLGSVQGAEHTSHAVVLLGHVDGDLKKARDYYSSTFATVHGLGNKRGMALTLRSLGELAVLYGKVDQAHSCWERASSLFDELGLADGDILRTWCELTR